MDDTSLPPNVNQTPTLQPTTFLDRWRAIRDEARSTLAASACGLPSSGEGSPAGQPGAEPPSSNNPGQAAFVPPLPPVEAACPPTSLDTSETSVGDSLISAFLAEKPAPKIDPAAINLNEASPSARFRHSGWWDIRRRIFDSLKRTGQSSSRISSFAECGAGSWIEHNIADPTRLRIKCNHCHDRLCTPCANQRCFRLAQALQAVMADRPHTFITLTLCGRGESLTDLVDRLYRHFRSLRAHPIWEKVTGGAAFLEIKWSDKAQRWHPHLHLICEARYIDQGELSDVWRGITRDSFIVDIRKVRDSEVSARYVTKYASKPLNMSFANNTALLDEALIALKGRRLCLCFGTWYGTPLDAAEDTEFADDLVDAGEWSCIMTLDDLLSRATSGDGQAIAMIRSLNCEEKWLRALSLK